MEYVFETLLEFGGHFLEDGGHLTFCSKNHKKILFAYFQDGNILKQKQIETETYPDFVVFFVKFEIF